MNDNENQAQDPNNLPSFYYAADAHNYGNNDFAFTDPSTWGDSLSNAGKFVLGAAYSGLNSFYNTGVAVANVFGADAEYNDTARGLASIDSDLGSYYSQHSEGIDIAGFLAGSFIPGLGGVKLFNAGKTALIGARTGIVGENIGGALGLLRPSAELATEAGQNIAASQAASKLLTTGTIKALSAGVINSTLEGAAFEAAVQATMFKSPLLDEQDAGDIAKSILIGGGISGVIGGTLEGAKVFGTIKKILKGVSEEEKPFVSRTELQSKAGPAERIMAASEDLANSPAAPTEGPYVQKFTSLLNNKVAGIRNDIRENFHSLVKGDDKDLGNQLADVFTGRGDLTDAIQYTTEIGRAATKLDTESALAAHDAASAKAIAEGKTPRATSKSILYVKLLGENAGDATAEAPPILNIADTVTRLPGQSLQDAVMREVNSYKFNPSKSVSVLDAATHQEVEARYIWAEHLDGGALESGAALDRYDFPLQERYLKEFKAQRASAVDLDKELSSVRIKQADGSTLEYTNAKDLQEAIKEGKQDAAYEWISSKEIKDKSSIDDIAKRTNVTNSYLNGAADTNSSRDFFAKQTTDADYTQSLISRGMRKAEDGIVDTAFLPTVAKFAKKLDSIQDVDGNIARGASYLAAKQKIYQQGVDNVVAAITGDLNDQLPELSNDLMRKVSQAGSSPGVLSFSNGNYGSPESFFQQIGAVTARLQKQMKDATTARLNAAAYNIANKSNAAIEYSAIERQILSTSEQYVLDPEGGQQLINRQLAKYKADVAAGKSNLTRPVIQPGAPEIIPIKNPETLEMIKGMVDVNGTRIAQNKMLRGAQGLEDTKDPATFYPTRPNPNDFKHFAFVYDNSLARGTAGHVSMIRAATEQDLAGLISKVPSNYVVRTKNEIEAFKQAQQNYQFDRTLHENYIDTDLHRAGAMSDFFPKTDPQKIAQDAIADQTRRDDIHAREVISAKYEPQFDSLRRLGDEYTNVASSRFGGVEKYLGDKISNPYVGYIKTALNIIQSADTPLLTAMNRQVDGAFSSAWHTISSLWKEAKTPADLTKINSALESYGVKTAYYDGATNALANATAPRGDLQKFIRTANSILSTLTLRMDPFNAINNAVGANVLLGSETKSLIRAITNSNSDAAGALAALGNVKLPGVSDSVFSPTKLIANAYAKYFSKDPSTEALKLAYTKNGWITSLSAQYASMLDDLTITGAESAGQLQQRAASAMAKAKTFADVTEKYAGNKLAEEMNRFVAAHVMDQITGVAKEAGILSDADAKAYINTFINRTQGNILASQRPLLFNGPIGQAVGLFQTYQFNLMQQLLRHVADGESKDAAMLLGLQGTLYGMNGMPAFSYLNTHVIGSFSANPQHKDIYSTTYGIAGKQLGDFLTYGLPSSLLQSNLYTRGDINPRQISVIPINPADIPIVSAFGAAFANIKNSANNIAQGGSVWQTILQGIEHNGLSRPLAGLAQVGQGLVGGTSFSTSKEGTVLYSNDLFSLANLSRLGGARPLDEAIVNDAVYRNSAYAALDNERKKDLVKAVKSTAVASGSPDSDQVEAFATHYAALGGDTTRFNQFMYKQITTANKTQAEKIIGNLKTPYAQNLQKIMGGRSGFEDLSTGGN